MRKKSTRRRIFFFFCSRRKCEDIRLFLVGAKERIIQTDCFVYSRSPQTVNFHAESVARSAVSFLSFFLIFSRALGKRAYIR